MTKQNVKPNTKSMRGTEKCRVVEVGVEKFGECLKQGPSTCTYAMPFGYCFLCTHPHVDEIIEHTKRVQLVYEPAG